MARKNSSSRESYTRNRVIAVTKRAYFFYRDIICSITRRVSVLPLFLSLSLSFFPLHTCEQVARRGCVTEKQACVIARARARAIHYETLLRGLRATCDNRRATLVRRCEHKSGASGRFLERTGISRNSRHSLALRPSPIPDSRSI